MCKPPRVVKVTLRTDGPFPPHYEIAFTCGHPEFLQACAHQAALAVFGRVLMCLTCEERRDV